MTACVICDPFRVSLASLQVASAAISTVALATGGSDRVIVMLDRQIRTAIARRQLIRFKYGSTIRVAEPHDYGIRHGLVRLLVYQRLATPFSRGWRMLDVAKISQLELLDDTFEGSRRASHSHHFEWDELFARVE